MDETVRAHVIITGRVQGVCFRMETRNAVRGIGGVSGWVKNRLDGKVEAVFEGEAAKVKDMLAWCETGPPRASVNHLEVNWQAPIGEFENFAITY